MYIKSNTLAQLIGLIKSIASQMTRTPFTHIDLNVKVPFGIKVYDASINNCGTTKKGCN